MKNYVSLLAAVIVAILIYSSCILLGVDREIASGAAGLPLVALPKVYEEMERRRSQRDNSEGTSSTAGIRSFDRFSISWPLVVLYSTAAMFGLFNIISFFAGIILGIMSNLGQFDLTKMQITAPGLIAFPVMTIAVYCIGRWIGSRCSKNGALALISTVLLCIFMLKATDYLFSDRETLMQLYGTERELSSFANKVLMPGLSAFLIFSGIGLVGYWRGKRRRLTEYMRYLLNVLPQHTRETLVNLAFEEAQMLASPHRPKA